MLDVVTIGSATRDVFLVTDQVQLIKSKKFSTGIGECVALGTKIDVDEILHTTGGGATNAAVTFAHLGFRTAVVSRIGEDIAGEAVLEELEDNGVKTNLIRHVKKGMTGYSTLLTEPSGERTVLVYRGVSSSFTPKDIPFAEVHPRWIYLTSLSGNMAVVKKIVKHAEQRAIKLAWNPGGGEIAKGLKVISPLLKHVSVFNLNKEEAAKLTKKKTIKEMLKALQHGENVVIITDGPKGAYACRGKQMIFAKTTGAKSVSRTGAGDAFGSGCVASLMQEKDLERALAIGTLNAEGVIGSLGAKRGILTKWPSKTACKRIIVKPL